MQYKGHILAACVIFVNAFYFYLDQWERGNNSKQQQSKTKCIYSKADQRLQLPEWLENRLLF